jgi:hypothetical protein
MTRPIIAALLLAAAAPAHAQSINVDFGQTDAGPPPSYAGAGRAGHWNSIVAEHGSTTFDLVGIDGVPTTVKVWQFGGLETPWTDDPDLAGDDATLMNDYLITYDESLESCLFFRNLERGSYRVIVYARMPARPDVLSYTSSEEEPGFPHYVVGGAWTGEHELLVSYSVHEVEVTASDGLLRLHSGIVPKEDPLLGAALNGVQIERIDPCPADVDDSGAVDTGDLLSLLGAWGACPGCPQDIDGDGFVAVPDLLDLLATWGPCR